MIRLALALSLLASAADAQSPGFDRLSIAAPHRGGDLAAGLWFPATAGTPAWIGETILFRGVEALTEASPTPGAHPLILVSHGSGGSLTGLSWLGAGLARQGAVVLMVNHPGSTSGDSTPLGSLPLDLRARDLSAALDQALGDPALAARIDPDRIAVLGFSMGGGTALQLAGARFDRAAYGAYCDRSGAAGMDCLWLRSGGVDPADLPPRMEADLRDPRISAVIGVDPAFGHAFTPESLAAMELPALLISLGETGPGSGWEAVDIGPQGANLAGQMPQARHQVIAPAWHFSFLAECKLLGPLLIWWEGEEPICSDPEGSDRGAVQAQVVAAVGGALGLPGAGALAAR